MSVSVTMPRLGESVTEGTVTRWLKQEGERVEADEPLLEVSTDKVDTEIPSPAAGVLTRIVVREDETAEVGSELAVIDGDGAGPAALTPMWWKPGLLSRGARGTGRDWRSCRHGARCPFWTTVQLRHVRCLAPDVSRGA